MSGKTRLVLYLLSKIECLNPIPREILFLYDQYQDEYEELKMELTVKGVEMTLRQGSSLCLSELEKKTHQTLIIIDDATEDTASSSDIAKITTNGRHLNASLWLIWHSLYSKHPQSRIISQNASYLFFLPSVRLISQLHTLDTQLRFKGALVSAYRQAVDEDTYRREPEHRYLLLDLAPTTPPTFRLRTNVTEVPQEAFIH